MEPEVDHLGDAVIGDQPIHQRHLAEGVVDPGGLRHIRQVVEQRRLTKIDIERRNRAALQQQELREQPRDHGFAYRRSRGTDNVDGRAAHRCDVR